MKISKLRLFRIFLSLITFSGLLLFFLNPQGWILSFSHILISLQFIPALKQFITDKNMAAVIGLAMVLLLTILFGRVYCSHLCPLGTMQDIIFFIQKKIVKRSRFSFYRFYRIIAYLILAVMILFLARKISLFTSLLDPFSNFGRIIVNIFKPALIFFNNIIAEVLDHLKVYLVYQIHGYYIPSAVLYAVIAFFLMLFISVIYRGRWYCQFCPVGTVLGICSKLSVFKIRIEQDKCISCQRCENVCKSGCIDSWHKTLDWQRCVGCFNCLDVCPHSLIYYTTRGIKKEKIIDLERRNFLFIFFTGVFSLMVFPLKAQIFNSSSRKIPKRDPVSPPGSGDHEHYNKTCTACHACISVCPGRVLVPAVKDYGLKGIFQPKLDYSRGFCGYDCNLCSLVCPAKAIQPISVNEKRLIQIGVVNQIKENCIVYRKGLECGACSEQCPTKAVYLIPYHGLHAPVLNQNICIGCGACENVCPVRPDKAIYVNGLKIHKKAKAPSKIKLLRPVDKGFPF